MKNPFAFKKDAPQLSEDEKTQLRHKKVRVIRTDPEALSDLPIELFLRLVGLFHTVPKNIRDLPEYAYIAEEFETLRLFIDNQLANDDGKNFAKYEMADYVHNLHLLLIGVIQLDFLESNFPNIMEEYRGHVDEQTYIMYLNSKLHQFIDKYYCAEPGNEDFIKIKDVFEGKMRLEYRNLVNEIRRARLFEQHIEDTRGYLMQSVTLTFVKVTIPAFVIIVVYYYLNYMEAIVNSGFIWIMLLSLSSIAGATGSLISVLLRIQGVRDNNQLAQNIVAFKFSVNAIKIAPVTGMVFAIVLSLIFSAGLVGGTLFPEGNDHWATILHSNKELAKLLVWCFMAGFSERLVPDMVDRLADRAKKAEEK